MQLVDGSLVFSPSDISGFTECLHLTRLEREVAHGRRPKAFGGSRYGNLIAEKGDEHEAEYLGGLRARGVQVTEVDLGTSRNWERAAAATAEAMHDGAEVIFQAAFLFDDPSTGTSWRGLADFLERVERPQDPTGLGSYGYEAVDTKLARLEKPSHILQLCFYSAGVEQIQGAKPERFHIELGSDQRASFPVPDFEAYYRRVRASFLAVVESDAPTEPYPCSHCEICNFRHECDGWLEERDHLVRVAGISRSQIERLTGAGLPTLTALARADPATEVPELRVETFEALNDQARLQVEAEGCDVPPWRALEFEDGRGFALLPEPSAGDVVFDIEGDPWWEPARGLDFLFGLVTLDGGAPRYEAIWGHDREGERRAFEQLIDFITERRSTWPDLHVYHYGAYEQTAIKQLMGTYGTREAEVDQLLRDKVFVDLHTVVRQALRAGVRSYSLKQTERLAEFERVADVGSGSEAVLEYEQWMKERDPELLEQIAAYNREDCVATLALRDWLIGERPGELSWFAPPEGRERDPERIANDEARERLRLSLVADADVGSSRSLAGQLLGYHQREARPEWWVYFERLERMSLDELVEDSEAIGKLERLGGVEPFEVRRSLGYTLSFPEQQYKLSPGQAVDPATGKGVSIESIDDDAGRLVITRAKGREPEDFPEALIPGRPYDDDTHRDALARLAESIQDGNGCYPALEQILAREHPRIREREGGASVQTNELSELRELALGLERSYLFVQGPPGSGKTWNGSRLITHLIDQGQRVGVAATSHKAIHNLLRWIEHAAEEEGVEFRGWKKGDKNEGTKFDGRFIETIKTNEPFENPDPEIRLLVGTSWLFTREAMDRSIDTLVIDEAGQVSLADALAMGTSARNVILLGDPLQLPQVVQGSHPQGTALSVLEHLLGNDATIPPDRGIFLQHTWRMHPDVCRFISEIVYDNRLGWEPHVERQTTAYGTGLRYIPVEHTGNGSASTEEADAVAHRVSEMVGAEWTDSDGRAAALEPDHFVVVAPYNAQVRRIRAALRRAGLADVPVGTVDKLQGQEAPVVFFSMATSTGEDVPRNLEFLFSRNRLNVAISRAQCLAHVVSSPRLLEARARTIEQMRLINALCRFVELAGG